MILRTCLRRPVLSAGLVSIFRPAITMPLRSNLAAGAVRANSTDAPDDVLFGSNYGVRTILLNKPAKLNSLDGSMARKILPRLQEYEKSQLANVVVIKGAGAKAFCAGGDVFALAQDNKEGPEGQKRSQDFFGLEYRLDHLIATYSKPYVAFLDGITMGGGVGLSLHGHFRIATEKTLFAMPETTIGFFPDVGASFFLPRMDGELGTYLALTSDRLKGVQAYYAGVATHYIHSSSLEKLEARLAELVFDDTLTLGDRLTVVNSTIEEFVTGLPDNEEFIMSGSLREAIDRCFKYNTVEEILTQLAAEQTPWAEKTIATIRARSPTSVHVTLRLLRYGRGWDIDEAFMREYHIAGHFMAHPDFVEGVEKQLAKPDKVTGKKELPVFKPATLEELSDAQIDEFFIIPPGAKDIDLIKKGLTFKEYPHHEGLPSEAFIKTWVDARKDFKKDNVVKHFVELRKGKVGVKEKLEEVLARMTETTNKGYLVWKN